MMLSSPKLKVIHLTTHQGLLEAIQSITPERTYKVIALADETLKRAGYANPCIAVCGINPHAGEKGLFGNGEEEKQLVPGVEKARAEGIHVEGPLPGDTVFSGPYAAISISWWPATMTRVIFRSRCWAWRKA